METTAQPRERRCLFPIGRLFATPGVLALGVDLLVLVSRHGRGDWGDLGDDDRDANESALVHGGRLFSAYNVPDGRRVWIITETDRSSTTVLLPEEY